MYLRDMCGCIPVPDKSGVKYILTFPLNQDCWSDREGERDKERERESIMYRKTQNGRFLSFWEMKSECLSESELSFKQH